MACSQRDYQSSLTGLEIICSCNLPEIKIIWFSESALLFLLKIEITFAYFLSVDPSLVSIILPEPWQGLVLPLVSSSEQIGIHFRALIVFSHCIYIGVQFSLTNIHLPF